jgi:hypothetical protein
MAEGGAATQGRQPDGGGVLAAVRGAAEWLGVLLPAGVVLFCMWAGAAFARVYRNMEMPLPTPAMLSLNWVNLMSKYWFLVLPAILACTVGVHAALRFTGGRRSGQVLACVWGVAAVVVGIVVLLGLSMPLLIAAR